MALSADPGREMLQGLQYPEVSSKSRPKRVSSQPGDVKGLTFHGEAAPWDVCSPSPFLERKPWVVASINGTAGLSHADHPPFLLVSSFPCSVD